MQITQTLTRSTSFESLSSGELTHLRAALLNTTPHLQDSSTYLVEETEEEEDDGFYEAISAVICSAVVLISSINLMIWL